MVDPCDGVLLTYGTHANAQRSRQPQWAGAERFNPGRKLSDQPAS